MEDPKPPILIGEGRCECRIGLPGLARGAGPWRKIPLPMA
jgi:hypothetical protein